MSELNQIDPKNFQNSQQEPEIINGQMQQNNIQETENTTENDENKEILQENTEKKEEIIQEKPKGCLIKEHTETNPLFICTAQNCNKTISRLVCMDCIQDPIYSHAHPEYLLKYNEVKHSDSIIIKQWPLKKEISKLYKNISQDLDNKLKELDEFFDNLQEQIIETLKETQKQIKQNIISQNQTTKENFDNLKKKLEKNFDLSELKEAIKNFESQDIDPTKFNQILDQFSQKQLFRDIEQNIIIDQYENSLTRRESLEFDVNAIPAIQNKILTLVKEIIVKPYKFEFEPLEQGKHLGLGLYQGFSQQANIFVSTKSFKRDQNIHFKFQLYSCPELQYQFYIGITKKGLPKNSVFWFNSGNQLSLTHDNNSRKPFKSSGEKPFMRQVFYEGQQYNMDICVKDNILTISDKEKYCVFENQHLFEDGDDWNIVFGKFGDFICRVL